MYKGEDSHLQNGRVRTSMYQLPSKINKNTLTKVIRINFFITLEINQRLTILQETFIQEKWLNLSKQNELCGILTCPIPILLSPAQQ